MALYGVSRGAEHALLAACLAAREDVGPSIDAVACLTAPDVICGALDAKSFRDAGDPGWRAWTWQSRSDALLPSTPIPVEAYGGPLFLTAGGKDQTGSPEMTRRIETRRIAAALPVEMRYEPDEGYMLRNDAESRHHARLLAFLGRHLANT